MSERKYFIDGFPICAAFYYCIAKRLGYTEDESKSLGLTRAIFFAAAKFGYIGDETKKVVPLAKELEVDQLQFAGLPTYIVHEKGHKEFFGIMGNDIIKPDQYNSQVINKFNSKRSGAYEYFIEQVNEFLKDKSDDELNSVISYDLYTEIRDQFREIEFYNALPTTTNSSRS
ncbi:hypothetical protein A3F06_03830 [candidate division TM6 bacterium RIFCSPHIGHO2_12_FULL_36_22]|nr:MAG: hypothetical protein A3F06_03830 [candidate division TM6 bacterium RIFCSPHIGHO2_12_FULL_36_22]